MKTKLVLLGAFLISNAVYCQFATNILMSNSGGQGTAYFGQDQYFVTWSIGEPIVETFTLNSYHFFNGFQVPIIVSIFESPDCKTNIKAFPNPTKAIVTLEKSGISEELFVEIYNLQQKVIRSETIREDTSELDFSEMPVGVYFIKISAVKSKTFIQTLKIEKIY